MFQTMHTYAQGLLIIEDNEDIQLKQGFLLELFELGMVIFPQSLGDSTSISSAINSITNKDFWRYDGSKTTGSRKSPTLLTGSAVVAGSNELTYKILYEEPLFVS